ncbi:unnamed protein product [Timema podura]|uniref:Uncharacterized protein n=1 Tax=Timema podura TaxID=61482 RepID=A0ABN7P1M9_TIMPD|nr:unnamed protein product [Timema podura]
MIAISSVPGSKDRLPPCRNYTPGWFRSSDSISGGLTSSNSPVSLKVCHNRQNITLSKTKCIGDRKPVVIESDYPLDPGSIQEMEAHVQVLPSTTQVCRRVQTIILSKDGLWSGNHMEKALHSILTNILFRAGLMLINNQIIGRLWHSWQIR